MHHCSAGDGRHRLVLKVLKPQFYRTIAFYECRCLREADVYIALVAVGLRSDRCQLMYM